MPELKNRMLFISHAWRHDDDYHTIVRWFNEANNFNWRNCSVPSHDALAAPTTKALMEGITRQISPAQGVLIIAGMYAAHSGWIDYEINEATRMGKIIIAIRPRAQERMPLKVQNAAHVLVNWNSASLIQAVRDNI